ncbi:MAG: hypothetical protein ACRYG4_22615 [Janthinobacterium lividum]
MSMIDHVQVYAAAHVIELLTVVGGVLTLALATLVRQYGKRLERQTREMSGRRN